MGFLKRLFGSGSSSKTDSPKVRAGDGPQEATSKLAASPATTSHTPVQAGTPPPVVVNRINEITWDKWHNPPDPERVLVIENLKVAGVTHNNQDGVSRQEILARMKRWEAVDLIREPNNVHDKDAVAVFSGMGQIGYIPADAVGKIARLMDKGAETLAKLSGLYGGKDGKSWGCTVDVHITLPVGAPSHTMRVVGITGKDEDGNYRKETAEEVSVGDPVDLYDEEDDEGNPVVLVRVNFAELGRLGKADAKKIHPILSEGRKVNARISSVSEEEDSKKIFITTIIL